MGATAARSLFLADASACTACCRPARLSCRHPSALLSQVADRRVYFVHSYHATPSPEVRTALKRGGQLLGCMLLQVDTISWLRAHLQSLLSCRHLSSPAVPPTHPPRHCPRTPSGCWPPATMAASLWRRCSAATCAPRRCARPPACRCGCGLQATGCVILRLVGRCSELRSALGTHTLPSNPHPTPPTTHHNSSTPRRAAQRGWTSCAASWTPSLRRLEARRRSPAVSVRRGGGWDRRDKLRWVCHSWLGSVAEVGSHGLPSRQHP